MVILQQTFYNKHFIHIYIGGYVNLVWHKDTMDYEFTIKYLCYDA